MEPSGREPLGPGLLGTPIVSDQGLKVRVVGSVPLAASGVLGCLGVLVVIVGASLPGSPFALKLPGAWFFATSSQGGWGGSYLAAVVVTYAGLALMLGAWFEVVRRLRRRPGTSLGAVYWVGIAWVVPIFVAPPLFSRDVYTYAAQGQMVASGINPYHYGPFVLGWGSYPRLVDPLWGHTVAPYGPLWERLSGWTVEVARHDVLASLVGFRVLAVVGIALISWGVPVLARSFGRDATSATALAVLNPAVLLVLVAGEHNDALMLGLLVAGCALARRQYFLPGLVVVSLAADIKVPALIGAIFIGWWWSGEDVGWRRRVPRLAGAVGIVLAVMTGLSALCGLGFAWVSELTQSGTVVSWLDPATATGLGLAHLAAFLGHPGHQSGFVLGGRAVALAAAAVISVVLLMRARGLGVIQALGWSLLLVAVLGPVVWPWYETWGFVVLAIVAEGWTLRLLLGLSALACFADLPSHLSLSWQADPVVVVVGAGVLTVAVVAYIWIRLLPSIWGSGHARWGGPAAIESILRR
jgi:alpha-1,6-mannosyltransferase